MALFQLSLITLLIIAVIFFIVWKITKKIFLTIVLIGVLMLLVSTAAGFLIYNDFKDLEKGFTEEDKLILLVNENEVITGVEFQKFNTKDEESKLPETISNSEAEIYTELLKQDDLEGIKGDNFKLFLIDKSILDESLSNKLQISDSVSLTKEEVLTLLEDDNELTTLYNGLSLGQESKIESKKQLKSFLFFFSVISIVQEKGPAYLFQQFREGDIVIYPETILIKMAKLIPANQVEKAIQTKFIKEEQVQVEEVA